MKTADFLLEIGVEEVPDWMIPGALDDLRRLFLEVFPGVEIETHATPRRLVLAARELPAKQPDSKETVTGPPTSAGPNAAAGFARKMGVDVALLRTVKTPKGDYLSYKRKIKGRRALDILSEKLPGIILGIAWPKTMTWTGKSGPRFIRPIRWLVALLAGKVVPFEIAGVKADKLTWGHRRLGQKKPIRVSDLTTLREQLRQNFVILDAAERRQRIEQGMTALRVRSNDKLLDTLVNITEYPTPIAGSFDREFLSLPEEVLVTVMQHHQKYFSVEDENGKLAPQFVAVMNIDRDEDGTVRHGHERVLRARFNDARFFWETDLKRDYHDCGEALKHVVFHAKLGSYYDKMERNVALVKRLGGDPSSYAETAARAAKCDLTTELVKEFPELQGVVGGLRAKEQGAPEEVWRAIYEQYEPVPSTRAGQIVALADRLDTLQGFFSIGLMPTGSKDPFALRRTALGVVRILVEGQVSYSLTRDLLPREDHRVFVLDRARYYFREVRGYRYDEVNAVFGADSDNLADVANRLEALARVRPTENLEPLAGGFKRIRNILKQAAWKDDRRVLDIGLMEPGPERDLYDEAQRVRAEAHQHKNNCAYILALEAIASLRPRVDLFFDKVLVMTPDERVRKNRLAFLAELLREFSTIADFSEIVISGD